MQDPNFFYNKRYCALSRVNIFAAVSIPKPLENFYTGLGYDVGPGLRITAGVDFYKYTNYHIVNGKIASQSTYYKPAFPFVAVGIDPVSLVNALNIFK
jgi:hypothetical protein